MPSLDPHGRVTYTLSPGPTAALRAVARRFLRRAATTSAFERNLASALTQLCDGVDVDDATARLIERHRALTPLAPPAAGDGKARRRRRDGVGSARPRAAGARRRVARLHPDATREWGSCGEVAALGLAFYGYGDTADGALAEARAARRPDLLRVFEEDGEERTVFPAVRSVDVHRSIYESDEAHDDVAR